ncbi:hypothetical protein QCD60_29465 [Pokkaliibacter sp. MBI-7]|uniref:hypothetical protein n=1 Tax=Pokkaliibacter sp. MBI-7 TaxID=3040600 RepID=UPI00244778AF|nr:hypothetical protein [Pokkaliibacter sp. MBI-7]MDH2434801.1 hypothetical protein [Pokkaliibacter sp. MBI-7]MDH2436646.1 hypothetical protein [Pokkaliibacter sp. MBI-7]
MNSTIARVNAAQTVTCLWDVIVPDGLIVIHSDIAFELGCAPYYSGPLRTRTTIRLPLQASVKVAEAMQVAEGHFREMARLAQVRAEQHGPHAPVLLPQSMEIVSMDPVCEGAVLQRYIQGSWQDNVALIPREQWLATQAQMDQISDTWVSLIHQEQYAEASAWQEKEHRLREQLSLSCVLAGEPAIQQWGRLPGSPEPA